MGWQKIGQLPIRAAFVYGGVLEDAMVVAGGVEFTANSSVKNLNKSVFRSTDGINWEKIDSDLNWSHYSTGIGTTFENTPYLIGGIDYEVWPTYLKNNPERGKLIKSWDVDADSSTVGRQINWSKIGSYNDPNAFRTNVMEAVTFMLFENGRNLSGIALKAQNQANQGLKVYYKKDVTRGGQWEIATHGDNLPNWAEVGRNEPSTWNLPDAIGATYPSLHWQVKNRQSNIGYAVLGNGFPITQRGMWKTTNGFNWIKIAEWADLPSGLISGIGRNSNSVLNNNTLVTLNIQGYLWRSSDGINWTQDINRYKRNFGHVKLIYFNGSLYGVGGQEQDPGDDDISRWVYKLV